MMLTKTKSKAWNRADFIQKWIKSLKSGKYKQGEGCLKDNKNQFCCLGVACDILGKEYNAGQFNKNNDFICVDESSKYYDYDELSGSDSFLPEDIADKLKTHYEGLIGLSKTRAVKLTSLNDVGINFRGIAAILENYPLVEDSLNRDHIDLEDIKLVKEMTERLDFIFRKTKYAKSWKRYCLVEKSNVAKLLK